MRVSQESHQQIGLREADPCAETRHSDHLGGQRPRGLCPDGIGQNGESGQSTANPSNARKFLSDPLEPLAFAGRLPAPHPAAADDRRHRRQFLQRAAGAPSRHRRANKGAHQPDLPGGQEVLLWVRLAVELSLLLLGLYVTEQDSHISVTIHKIRSTQYKRTLNDIIEQIVDTESCARHFFLPLSQEHHQHFNSHSKKKPL